MCKFASADDASYKDFIYELKTCLSELGSRIEGDSGSLKVEGS